MAHEARGARPDGRGDHAGPEDESSASGGLFDLRYLIGGLFTAYGIVLIVSSFFVSNAKAGGIDINLWLGLSILVLGVFFLGWARSRPLRLEGSSALTEAEGSPGRQR